VQSALDATVTHALLMVRMMRGKSALYTKEMRRVVV
jgi:hypothetical protein